MDNWKRAAVELRDTGMSCGDVSDRLGVPYQKVYESVFRSRRLKADEERQARNERARQYRARLEAARLASGGVPKRSNVQWSPEEEAKLRQMFKDGFTDLDISEAFNYKYSKKAILTKRHRLGIYGETRARAVRQFESPDEQPTRGRDLLLAANILHLVDLKRAGHSPTRTELQIASKGLPQSRFDTFTPSGLSSSPAALCAE